MQERQVLDEVEQVWQGAEQGVHSVGYYGMYERGIEIELPIE